MATRSIVPRADGEGSVGTSGKAWGGVWAKKINGADPNWFYLVRLNRTAYIVGDIAFSPSLPSAMFLKCIEAGTTGATEPDYTGAAVGGTVTDGTVVWQYYDLLSGSGVPLGTILPYSGTGDTPPYGFLFCEGQAISRAMYPDLFELIGTTYGAGNGSTTFNLPNMIGKYPQGDTTAGTVKAAGLPNIEGSIGEGLVFLGSDRNAPHNWIRSKTSGSFSYATGGDNTFVSPSGTDNMVTAYGTNSFDASRSSSIYGASDTVTPPTLTVRWIIKAYDAPTPSSAQIDLSQYASDIAARLTREQTPAFNKRDVITTSGTYTAPVTGWYRITVKGGGGGGQGGLEPSSNAHVGGGGGGEGGTTIGYEKMTAGDTVLVVIGAGGTGGTAGGGGGTNGGNTTVTANNNSYVGGGGSGSLGAGGAGGSGDVVGAAGQNRIVQGASLSTFPAVGSAGGGAGGGRAGAAGVNGGGGSGGSISGTGVVSAGGAGGNGYAEFSYFDPTLM